MNLSRERAVDFSLLYSQTLHSPPVVANPWLEDSIQLTLLSFLHRSLKSN